MEQRRLCTRTLWPEIRARIVCGMQLKVGMVKTQVKMFMMEQQQAASSELSEGLLCTLRLHQIEENYSYFI